MGACLSLDEEERRAQMRSEEIDRQLAEFAKQERNVIRILLLGTILVNELDSYMYLIKKDSKGNAFKFTLLFSCSSGI